MTKSAKPKTIKEWEKVCKNLNDALRSAMEHEEELYDDMEHLEIQMMKLEEQLTMSVGVIKYLETKIVRPDPV
jgi:hypothetical protein